MRHPTDTDMDFLAECSNDELEFLVRLIIDVGGKTNQLDNSAAFKMHRPDHQKYVGEIIEEIQRYAGNTVCNMSRGYGVSYREALTDTLDDLKVGYDKRQDLCDLEKLLLSLGLDRYLKQMKNDSDREAFRNVLQGTSPSANLGRDPSAAMAAGVAAGAAAGGVTGVGMAGAASAAGSAVVSHAVIAEAAVAMSAAAIGAVIGSAVAAPLGVIVLSAPAKRVVIPAVLYIANLRKRHNEGAL